MTLHLQTLELIEPINMIEATPPKEATIQRVEPVEIVSVPQSPIFESVNLLNSCTLALPASANTKSTIQYGDGWSSCEID